VDETDAFGKGEKGQRVAHQRHAQDRRMGYPAGLGAANVECEERAFDALCSLRMTIPSGYHFFLLRFCFRLNAAIAEARG
jgi:hypothetical protein